MPPPLCHSALRLGLRDMRDRCWHSLEIKDLDNASFLPQGILRPCLTWVFHGDTLTLQKCMQ